MAENKFRIGTERSNEARMTSFDTPGKSAFSGWENRFKLESYFEEGFPVQYLP